MERVRIYEVDAEPADVSVAQLVRIAGHGLAYHYDETPGSLDTGWYVRPRATWGECEAVAGAIDARDDGLCHAARGLLSEDGENPEYDRAIGELLTEALGLPLGDGQPARVVAALRTLEQEVHA